MAIHLTLADLDKKDKAVKTLCGLRLVWGRNSWRQSGILTEVESAASFTSTNWSVYSHCIQCIRENNDRKKAQQGAGVE